MQSSYDYDIPDIRMDDKVKKVLDKGIKIRHRYDFGDTTTSRQIK
jgi:hypothetical protein